MHWEQIEHKWELLKSNIKEKWNRLTDDELDEIVGKSDALRGKLQDKYGYTRYAVDKELERLCKSFLH